VAALLSVYLYPGEHVPPPETTAAEDAVPPATQG
jgi:hypothetical protein